MIRKVFLFLLIALILIQFIRPKRNLGSFSGPADISHYVSVPDTVGKILAASCYDCHSNRTIYPWYAEINPIGFWLNDHIEDGKRSVNFSDLSTFPLKKINHRLDDIVEQLDRKEMPLSSYTFIHHYAILSPGQVQLLKDWTATAKNELATKIK